MNLILEVHIWNLVFSLGKGAINGNFGLDERKSKLAHSLKAILFDQKNDEISYYVLFMDSLNESNLVKFFLDVNNFKQTVNNLDSIADYHEGIS